MKLAVSSYSLSKWQHTENRSIYDVIDWIAENAPAIEFSGLSKQLGKHPLKEAEKIYKYCQKRNLRIVGYCCGAELFHLNDNDLQKQIETLKKELDIANILQVKNIRHDITRGFPKNWKAKKSFQIILKRVTPAIREIADYASNYKIITSLENHGFYMQKSDRVKKLIDTVNHPNFKLTLDIGNFLCVNEDPKSAVKKLAKYAIHVHIKDFHIKSKSSAPPPEHGWLYTPTSIAIRGAILGHGNIDLLYCVKTIKKSGYKGWFSLEFEGLEEPRFGVKTGIDYAKKILKL